MNRKSVNIFKIWKQINMNISKFEQFSKSMNNFQIWTVSKIWIFYLNYFWIWIIFKYEQILNVNNFRKGTIFDFEQISEYEQFLNLNNSCIWNFFELKQFSNMNTILNWNNFWIWTKSLIWNNFRIWKKKSWIWTIFEYEQTLNWNNFIYEKNLKFKQFSNNN